MLGQTCADGNSGGDSDQSMEPSETLAHELGHALSRYADVPGMPEDDLMMSPSSYPATLTTGQCFRANVNQVSVLNSLPVRTEPTRACPDSSTDSQCPPLTIHK